MGLVLAGNSWYYDESGDMAVSADNYSKLPALEFLYGNYWLQALPEDYMGYYNGYYWGCFIDTGDDSSFILGSSFLRGFYSTHDYANKRFGFAPHSSSTKRAGELNSGSSTPLPNSAGSIDDDKKYFESLTADSVYFLNGVLMISSLLTFALI